MKTTNQIIHLIWIELLWVAPELLPVTIVPGTPATQKGDVYSFAIILEEIVIRGGPYEAARQFLDVQAILERVAAHETAPFRPFVGQRDCPPDVLDLMEKCWADNPDERPPFSTIRTSVHHIMKYEYKFITFHLQITSTFNEQSSFLCHPI